MKEDIKEKIKSFISEKILKDEVEITCDTPLYSNGLLSSMGHLKLVNMIERTFKISIPKGEVSLKNFDSINLINSFIQNKIK